ncbi:MAG: diheme cytochrome c [Burkholderiaceae bacterium]|nr:diheme cytochrome c [Burkholderiaceae bacterium]MCD8518171.1 diheme cytochrome c [Burkholderiaceae bacterium]
MNGLESHYGTDASLDEATVIEISNWLQTNAGGHKAARAEPPEDRITRSRWFIHEHDDIRNEVWLRPSIKSAANCAACHTRAEQGDFDEDFVRIPK